MEEKISKEYDGRSRVLYGKACPVCGKVFYLPRHVLETRVNCGRECTWSAAAAIRIELDCSNCGIKFSRAPSRVHTKSGLHFCTKSCKDSSVKKNWESKYKPSSRRRGYRAEALQFYGIKCAVCGYDKDEEMVDVDHRDSNRGNNHIDNLQVLCVWCHALKTRKVEWHARIS